MLTQMLKKDKDPKADIGNRTRLTWLRKPPKKPSPASLRHLTTRIEWIESLHLPPLPDSLPLGRLRSLYRRTSRYRAGPLLNFNPIKRWALLYCYLVYFRRDLIDQSVEMVGRMKTDLWRRGKNRQDEHLKDHAPTSNENLIILTDVAEAVLRAFRQGFNVFDLVFSIIGPDDLQGLIDTNRQIVRPRDMNVFDLVVERYQAIRSSWLKWFSALRFHPSRHTGVLSLQHVVRLRQHRKRVTEVTQRLRRGETVRAPLGHISTRRWTELILQEGVIQPDFYEMCGFENLYTGVLSGQIAVEGSYRYQAFDSYLLPTHRWEELRDSGQTRIAITGTFDAYLADRLSQMQTSVNAVAAALEQGNSGLSLEDGKFKLQRPGSAVPVEAKSLQRKVDRYFPQTDLTDVILDVDSWTDCLSEFRHMATGEPLVGSDRLVLVAALMAMGMNLSFHRMAMATPFTYKDLVGAATWYIREETVQAAQNRLDTFILHQPNAALWGRGTTVSSDGMRFPVATNVAHSQHNPHFLGLKRGMSLYTHTADIWGPLGQQLVPPNDREALYAIDMLENHPPEFEIYEHYTDTAGFTEHVFAFSTLLGYYFAPLLRDLMDQRLFSLPGLEIPPILRPLFKGRANTRLMGHQWDDILRSGTSIRYGTVSARC
jgi:TnpA family transposase